MKPTPSNTRQCIALNQAVSILMPVCNEADLIADTVQEWAVQVIHSLPPGSELIFDDASSDQTFEILIQLQKQYPFIKIHHQNHKDGFFNAAMRLYRLAQCPLVFFTDSDGQYVPSEFWKVANAFPGQVMVHGAKMNRKDPLYRKIASTGFNWLARLLFRTRFHDINSAFRLMDRNILLKTLESVQHLPILLNAELLIRLESEGYPMTEVRVAHRKRKFGVSRGLPLRTFIKDVYLTWHGLLSLRTELKLKRMKQTKFNNHPIV